MKQVIGSNPFATPERVSIQQSLDGHSFSRPVLAEIPEGSEVRVVELILPGSMLVPERLLSEESARDLLAANGMPAAPEEQIVVCRGSVVPPKGDTCGQTSGKRLPADDATTRNGQNLQEEEEAVVALVAVEKRILHEIRERFPEARFTTPLLDKPLSRRKCVWICRREQLLYIKVYEKGLLRLAEVIPARTEAETGYFIEELGQILPLKEYELRITGEHAKELRKWIGKQFEKAICE